VTAPNWIPDPDNPSDVARAIVETKNRIAAGVRVVADAEKNAKKLRRASDLAHAYAMKNTEGPEYIRKSEATIASMPHRAEAEDAELAARYAERQSEALSRELFAWQSILKHLTSVYEAAGVR
jgi:hypothetical protein